MTDCRQLVVPVLEWMNISLEDYPKSPIEMKDMTRVPYASAIGTLMYVMVCTRSNIAQAVGVLSHFMADLKWVHWDAMKRVFKYL